MRRDSPDDRSVVLWAAECAEHVIGHFEQIRPTDDRPRRAIEAARAWVRGELEAGQAREAAFAAHSDARDCEHDAARAAARAAGHAAASTHVADHAGRAAAYAVAAATHAADPTSAAAAATAERDWQDRQLPASLRAVVLPGRGPD